MSWRHAIPAEAVTSVLKQQTNFKFNCIIVDNHSTDGTTKILRDYTKQDERVIHVVPELFGAVGGLDTWRENVSV